MGMLAIALCALAACSKQGGQSANSTTSSADSTQGSVALLGIYSIPLNGASFLVTELENNGKTSIKAFQAKWTITDDLGGKVADDEIKFTSDTQFGTTNGLITAHVIAPGEQFAMVEQAVTGDPDKVYAVRKEDVGPLLQMYLGGQQLDDFKTKKKTTFEVEQVVTQ